MTSQTSQQDAAAAATRILSFYDTIPAADPKAFAAGLAAMLMIFPRNVIERAVDPVSGVPAKVKFLNLAAIRELLDGWHSDAVRFERLSATPQKQIEAPRDPEADARMVKKFKNLAAELGEAISISSSTGTELSQ